MCLVGNPCPCTIVAWNLRGAPQRPLFFTTEGIVVLCQVWARDPREWPLHRKLYGRKILGCGRWKEQGPIHQARKRHININFLVRLLLGHPGNVPGTNRVCPWDKLGLSQGQTQVFFLFYTAEAQFVPGTNPVCPWDISGTKGGRQSLCVKSLCAFFVP